jgi:8-amino-7-oxononanoate synthase
MTGFDDIRHELDTRKAGGLYRTRRTVGSAAGRELLVDGRKLLNFSSNDYLGLANDPRVKQAFMQAVDKWGVGSGGSHLICGHTKAHAELEEALAEFTGRSRCLLFSSGYAANLGTINGLLDKSAHVFEDRLNHASLLDGGLSSGARFKRFAHRDYADLEKKLTAVKTDTGRKLIITDGTFSMDGTTCDLEASVQTARNHQAWLMLDEAHSLGVLGEQGRGLVDPQQHGSDDVQVLIGTLGKAFGTQGGFVAGSEELIESLIQSARTYIYSTALPSAVAVATLTSLKIAREEEWRRDSLRELVNIFRNGAAQLGLQLLESTTPLQPVLLGNADIAMQISQQLEESGLLITAIRPPTVPEGTARLRITFSAEHTNEDVERLLTELERTITPVSEP